MEAYGYIPNSQDGLNLLSADELTKSIKQMQKFAALPQTGVVDQATLRKMRMPRCGLPDVIAEQPNSSLRRQKRFTVYGPKWTKVPVTWR